MHTINYQTIFPELPVGVLSVALIELASGRIIKCGGVEDDEVVEFSSLLSQMLAQTNQVLRETGEDKDVVHLTLSSQTRTHAIRCLSISNDIGVHITLKATHDSVSRAEQELKIMDEHYRNSAVPVRDSLLYRTTPAENGVVYLTLGGTVDNYSVAALRHILTEVVADPDCSDIIVNMRELSHIDSGGFGIFINTLQILRLRIGGIYLVGCNPLVTRVLQLTRLNRVLPVCRTVKDAYQAINYQNPFAGLVIDPRPRSEWLIRVAYPS